jgi:hypothetical protein
MDQDEMSNAPNLICDEIVTLLVSSVVDRESRQTNDYKTPNLICDEMVTLLVSSVVDSESRQTNDYKIDINLKLEAEH